MPPFFFVTSYAVWVLSTTGYYVSEPGRDALVAAGWLETEAAAFVLPYSPDNIMRGFDGAGCRHQAIDFGGVGENGGVGQPIVAMVDAVVVLVGRPEQDPGSFGRPDTRSGTVSRGGKQYPRRLEVPGYGTVYPFTRNLGAWRSGAVLVTRAKGTDIDGFQVRYMHLAAIRPDLKPGDVIRAGEEIGLMGGTASQSTPPHLHLDIEDLQGRRVDPAPLLGLSEAPSKCKPRVKRSAKSKKKKPSSKKSRRR